MDKVSSTIDALVNNLSIPRIGKFDITEQILVEYFLHYKRLFGKTELGTRYVSNTKMARRLAGLNLLKENISRGTKSTDIKAGQVYLISNPAFPEHYKLGATYNIEKRLAQYQTYSPYRDYKVEKYDFVLDKFKVEKLLLNHPSIQNALGEWVLKDNAVNIFNDLSRHQLTEFIGSW